MACMICPPSFCLELRLVSPDDENVADITFSDTSELGPRDIPVERVEVKILDRAYTPLSSESGGPVYAFEKGQNSLLIHNLERMPELLQIRYFREKDISGDATDWGPVKKAAVAIGNQKLQQLAGTPPAAKGGGRKQSKARQNALAQGWGFLSTTYMELTPPPIQDDTKISEEREASGVNYNYPTSENNLRRFFPEPHEYGHLSLLKAKKTQCGKCDDSCLFRLVIEIRGLTCLKLRLHPLEDWNIGKPCHVLPSGALAIDPGRQLFQLQKHSDNTLNLASLACLTYADFEWSEGDNRTGSIYDFFRKLAYHSEPKDEEAEEFIDTSQPVTEFRVNTERAALFLKEKPYQEGYPLGDLRFFFNWEADAQGFAASDRETIIIGLRGTQEPKDRVTDAKFSLVSYNEVVPSPALVHKGFMDSIEALRDEIRTYCKDHNAATKQIYVLGHSLGGAMGTLLALALHNEYNKPVMLYTFGCPRVGNAAFVRRMLSSGIVHYRFVNHNDLVTRNPDYSPQIALSKAGLSDTIFGMLALTLPDFTSQVYLHHGNFCHIEKYAGSERVHVRLAKADMEGNLLESLPKSQDSAFSAGWEKYNPLRHVTAHSIRNYIENLTTAYKIQKDKDKVNLAEESQLLLQYTHLHNLRY